MMSRRKISVKDLGQVDCQGWLYRKKEGKAFLRGKWKKYWFVLQRTSLYWYSCQTAEKAEGYINVADFTVDQAKDCRKKYAMKASHPEVVTLFFAAETVREMNKWLNKLSTVATESSEENSGKCYSEGSDQEQEEAVETSCHLYSEQLTTDSVDGDVPPPRSTSSPCRAPAPASGPAPASIVTSESSEALAAGLTAGGGALASGQTDGGGGAQGGLSGEGDDGEVKVPESQKEHTCDEMERLYTHLKRMRLSPTGQLQPSTQRDFRASFFRRCKNDNMNDKLHLARTLNSTLKSKEADLLALEQVLEDPTLTALKYRQWKVGNVLLLQEIIQRKRPGGGSRELHVRPPEVPCVDETSV